MLLKPHLWSQALSILLCSQPLFGRIDQCRFASSKGMSQLGGLGGGEEGEEIVFEGAVNRQHSFSFLVLQRHPYNKGSPSGW